MNAFERWSLWVTSGLTAATGIGYFWTKHLMSSDDPWAVVNSPLEPWFLRTHVMVAPLLVFVLGAITTRHVWRQFRSRVASGRRTGVITGLVAGPMVLTGYLIQVVTGAGWLRAIVIAHIAASFAYVVGLLLHQAFVGRRGTARPMRARRAAARESPARSRREAPAARAGPGGMGPQ